MKKYLLLVLVGIFSCLQLSAQSSNNASPKHEFRATWCATVTNIDWPTTKVTKVTVEASRTAQQKELTDILDALQAGNINAVCLQVRSQCDAFYKSEYEPWAAELTGTRGEDPGYDPLQYAIEQAHARGIEIHVWVNPFRVVSHKIMPKDETPGEQNSAYRYHPISNSDLLFTHTGSTVTPDMVIEYTTDTKYDANKQVEANTTKYGQVLNPGYEGVRQHIVKVILDIVKRYDIDGVVMDDYFYPSVDALTPDDYDRDIRPANFDAIKDVNKNGNKVDDWRRSNVDDLIQRIYNGIKNSSKPWVRFGMGPGGVWSNEPDAHAAYGLTMPSTAAKASNPYSSLCCNTVEWIKRGWVDYVNPQIYWTMDASVANYVELCKWWGNICELYSNEKQRVHFYPSQAGYKVYNYDTKNSKYAYPEFGEGNPAEIINQINEVNRENLSSGYTGSVIFSNKDFLKMKDAVKAACYQQKALVPPMAWKSTEELDAPNTLRINGKKLTWAHDNAERFTVYIYPKGVRMSQAIEDVNYLQGVVYGTEFTLPNSFDITTHNVAVRTYDRYGVEHEAAEYGPDVTYVLNGGIVESVPTNEELWTSFKAAAGLTTLGTLEEIKTAGEGKPHTSGDTPCGCRIICGQLNAAGVQTAFGKAEWKWLQTYIASVQTALATTALTDAAWRYAIAAFFLQSQHSAWPASADFTEAGKPEKWGPAFPNGGTGDLETSLYTLPDFIDEEFTLPTASSNPRIYHPNEYTFAGWIDSIGNSIETLHKNYRGIVYAQWGADITWVLNGGVYTGKGDLPLHVHDTYILPTAFTMRRAGYKFVGWYASSDFQGEKLITINSGVGTLYARWEPATPVTWHPYPYYDVTNEDLWELFIEDYNAFYNSNILGENRSYENRAYQPIGNAFGFMQSGEKLENANGQWINKEGDVVGTEAAAHHRFPDGRAKDFMTHPQSPWKWLGDYIHKVASDGVTPTNEALWEEFKLYYKTFYNENRADQPMNMASTFMTQAQKIMTDASSEYKWLGDYIAKVTTDAGRNLDTEILWRFAVHAFFNCSPEATSTYNGNADFTTAGKPENWTKAPTYPKIDYSFDTNKEVEWRKHVHTFFNKTNSVTYTVVGNTGSKTETTVDFSTKGQSKPNGDPAAGWYNAWWNATFPEYMMDNEALPKVKRCGYVFGGWYYGNDKGYIFTEGTKADTTAYDSENNYKNHLWGRWLELCLYEGYVDADPAALDANEQPISPKVNNNVEMVICNAEEIDRTKVSRKVDVERKLIGGTYNTMFLPFGINGQGTVKKDDDGNYISGSGICGKKYYLNQVVDDDGNPLLDPATTSILVYDGAEVETIGGEKVIAYNFHEYAEADSLELLLPYQPFLIKPENDITVRMHFWSALMQAPANAGARTSAAQAFVEGVLAPTVIPVNPEGDNTLILVADNRLAKVTTQGEMLGLRLYFTVPKDVSPSARSIIRVNNAPAGIDDIETPQQGAAVIKIMQNGNIYIIRNGKMYDIMGREIGDKR